MDKESKIKILFCTNTFDKIHHGPAKFANILFDSSGNNGLEIRILTEDTSAVKRQGVYKNKLSFSKIFPPLGMLLRILDYKKEIKQIEKEFDFDIVIFNHAMLGLWTAMSSKKKVIGMLNDSNSVSLSLSNFQLNSYWIRHYIFRFFEKWTLRYLDLIIVNSLALKKEAIEKYSIPSNKVELLYKGINIEEIEAPQSQKELSSQETITVLFVKSDYTVGGLRYLTQALQKIKEYKFKLIVVGPNEKNYKEIKEMCGTSIHLDFKGKLNQKEVYHLLSQEADIFCVPSLKEGLGVANMEALIHKLPVVSSNVGGIPEVLDFGKAGWLCESENAASLSQGILDCITNNEKRFQKSNHGYEHVKRQFDSKLVIEKVQKLIRAI